MLAGLMSATILSGIAPAYAQTMDNGRSERAGRGSDGPRGDGQRGGPRGDGQGGWGQRGGGQRDGGVSPRWQGNRPDRPASPVTQPAVPQPDRQWQNGRGQPDANGQRPDWRQNQRPQIREQDRRDWNEGRRADPRDGRRDEWRGQDNRGGNDRDRDRNDGRWNNGARPNGGWTDGRRFDDRTRWSSQQRWNNGWRQDRRYDWNSYRNRYGDRYRLGSYNAPRGWNYGYRQFSVGIVLDRMLYSNSYWLNDPYSYRLPPAYGTLRWVRYYDDAMLVDVRDGYVVDVIHDFFW